MSKPRYIIEVWPYGLVLCSPSPVVSGIPLTAFEESEALFPQDAVIDSGITLQEIGL